MVISTMHIFAWLNIVDKARCLILEFLVGQTISKDYSPKFERESRIKSQVTVSQGIPFSVEFIDELCCCIVLLFC